MFVSTEQLRRLQSSGKDLPELAQVVARCTAGNLGGFEKTRFGLCKVA